MATPALMVRAKCCLEVLVCGVTQSKLTRLGLERIPKAPEMSFGGLAHL